MLSWENWICCQEQGDPKHKPRRHTSCIPTLAGQNATHDKHIYAYLIDHDMGRYLGRAESGVRNKGIPNTSLTETPPADTLWAHRILAWQTMLSKSV
jgi:hypothetical protein